MGRRNAKAAEFSTEVLEDRPLLIKEDTRMPEPSRVFWRAETTFSEGEDEDESSSADVKIIDPSSAKANSLRQVNAQLLEVPVEHQKLYTWVESEDKKTPDVYVEVDLEKYMAAREMTPLQERVNALTMIPPPLICIFFVLSGNWVTRALISEAMQDLGINDMSLEAASATFEGNGLCMDGPNVAGIGWIFQNIHALPPLPLMATVLGVVIHAPWSFLYHWTYAHVLSPTKRTDHWSRRMDQAMLHISAAMTSFGTCGYWNYFLATSIFAADSFYRQFESKVRPQRNQARLGIAIAAWTIPILKRGNLGMFSQVFATLAIGLWFFVKYPIGGWSHAVFHLMLIPLMPLLMIVGSTLPASQEHLRQAAQCFALAEHRASFS